MKIKQDHCRFLLDDGSQCPNSQAQESQFCEEHAQWLSADRDTQRTDWLDWLYEHPAFRFQLKGFFVTLRREPQRHAGYSR